MSTLDQKAMNDLRKKTMDAAIAAEAAIAGCEPGQAIIGDRIIRTLLFVAAFFAVNCHTAPKLLADCVLDQYHEIELKLAIEEAPGLDFPQ